jgi:hypothetical protein
VCGSVADYETTESLVADENVRSETKDEILDSKFASSGDSPCQIVRRCSIVEDIRWTTDPESGVLSEWLVAPYTSRVEPTNQLPVRIDAGTPRI